MVEPLHSEEDGIRLLREPARLSFSSGCSSPDAGAEPEADQEPIVVVSDVEFAALPLEGTQVAGLSAQAQNYLHAQGITDERTWAAFRLEQIDTATQAHFGYVGKRQLRPDHGISIPTFDPRQPDIITGIIRHYVGHHTHKFITASSGIAGPVDLDDQPRIVLATNPLTAMRLHQAGVRDVALVDDPAVLLPLRDWLAARAVVIAAHKHADEAVMRAALGPHGDAAHAVMLAMDGGMSIAVRETLGIAGEEPRPPQPISLQVLHDLASLAQGRLDAGEAQAALDLYGASIPDLVRAYRIGYLPADYRTALAMDARNMLVGKRCGNALVLPAFNEDRCVVDLLIIRANGTSKTIEGMWPEPRGLFAPEILHGRTTLNVTNSFHWLVRLFAQGHRDVLFLRGPEDVRQNARRLTADGLRQVVVRARRGLDPFVAALQAAGLQVTVDRSLVVEAPAMAAIPSPETVQPLLETPATSRVRAADVPDPSAVHAPEPTASEPAGVAAPPPADPHALVFVEVERDGEVAIFQAGLVRYAVTLREDGLTQRRVVIRAHGKSCNHDLDLAVPAQRERTAGSAARQVGLPSDTVVAHLVALLAAVQAQESAAEQVPAVAVSAADRTAADGFLAAPDLLDLISTDLTALGWVAEASTKHLLYLTAISRLLPSPVWAVYQAGAGAAPWQGLGCIAALTPPEARLVFHRVTDAALTQADRASLRHRLLIVDQAETLRPEAALALRVLHERGGVGWAMATAADAPGGAGAPSLLADWRGPVAVLAAAVGRLDHRCRDCFLAVTVDESPAQTARILADQRQRLGSLLPAPAGQTTIINRHHAAQRLLERLPVVIPFVERIVFPASRVRHRAEQAWLLGLIAASALLHQRQRQHEAGAVVASEADFAIAVRSTQGLLGQTGDGISPAGRRLLDALTSRRLSAFTMADIGCLFPDWSRFTYRAALQDLLDFGYLESPRGGRGRLRPFKLVLRAAVALQADDIRLRPVGAPPLTSADVVVPVIPPESQLAEVGGNGSANFIPVRTGT